MNRETIEKHLQEVNAEIQALTQKRAELEKTLIESADTFAEKFRAWWNSSDKVHNDWILDEDEHPHLRKYFDDRYDLERHRTYDMIDLMEEDLMFILDPAEYQVIAEEHPQYKLSDEQMTEYTAAAEEMMSSNLGSFTCDW